MEHIDIDTIGPIDENFGLRYIIVIIDTFTRYVELFPKRDVFAMAAADALWRHTCRFTAPLQISNKLWVAICESDAPAFHEITGIKHHMTIPYS